VVSGDSERYFSFSERRKNMGSEVTRATDVVHRIKHILVKDMQLNVTPEEIPDDYSLLEGGLALDSILIAELIAQIEDQFGLQLDDRVLQVKLLNNLSLLAEFVAQERLTAKVNTRIANQRGQHAESNF
jgi:acyl carrier protein